MKYLMVKSNNLEVIGMYEADAPRVGGVVVESDGANIPVAHVPLQDGIDPRYAKVHFENGSYSITDGRTYLNTKALRLDFAEKIIDEFLAGNEAQGVSSAISYGLVDGLSTIILALKLGLIETALFGIKNIPQEARDGVYITDAKLLYFANQMEGFLGLPMSTSV
jgi:hypothetical protein